MTRMKWMGTALLCLLAATAIAQQPKKEVREGNKLYQEQKYKEAAAHYQEAVRKQPNYIPGLFNLGNAQYKQQQFEASRKIYEGTAKTATEKEQQAAAHYNIGNTYLEEKKYKEAVEAYKNALRKNPQDEQAKYNLSYALEMLKNQQGGGGNDKNKNEDKKDQQNKDKQDQQDENKDKKEGENKEDKKEQEDKQQQDQQNKKEEQEEKEKRPQPQPSKLSEQQAEQLLNALQQEEKKLQDKMKQGKAVPVKVEKDW